MFLPLSDAARLAVRLADQEALRLGHDRIDTEHLLLGLLQLHDCVAARVLAPAGIHLQRVRERMEEELLFVLSEPVGERRRLSAAARKSIHLALAAAERLGHAQVGTGHLLLGLLEEAEGLAFRVLCQLNVHRVGNNLSRVAERVIAEMRKERGWDERT